MLKLIFSLSTLWWLILLLYIPACFGLIVIVLLQKGKGQGLAGAFGMGGGMDTIFGPRSSKSLPQKLTYASAGIFMALALIMSILSGKVNRPPAPELVMEASQTSLEGLFAPSSAAEPPAEGAPGASAEVPPVEGDPSGTSVEIRTPDEPVTQPSETISIGLGDAAAPSVTDAPAAEEAAATPPAVSETAPAPPVEVYDAAPESTAPDTGAEQ